MHGSLQPSYVIVAGSLFEVAVQPLYFGTTGLGTRLGYVLLGYSVDRRLAEEVSQATSAEVIFYANKSMVATTLDDRFQAEKSGPQHRRPSFLRHTGRGYLVRRRTLRACCGLTLGNFPAACSTRGPEIL